MKKLLLAFICLFPMLSFSQISRYDELALPNRTEYRTWKQRILSNNRTAGDYLIRSSKQKYTAWGFEGGAIVFAAFGILAESGSDDNEGSSAGVFYIASFGCLVTATVFHILSVVSTHKAGIKLNERTTIGFTQNGLGATIKL